MTLTLPQSLGGIKTFDSVGDLVMRSTLDAVEIYKNLIVDGTNTVGGETFLNDDVHITGTLDVTGTTDLGGTLTLTADLNAAGHRITGAELSTGSDAIIIAGGTITMGAASLTLSGGYVRAMPGITSDYMQADVSSMGDLTTGDIGMVGDLGSFAGNIVLDNGDVTCVALHETSARAGKADLQPLTDPRKLLDVPTYTYRKARDVDGPRMVGIMAEDLADAGFEELIRRDDDGAPAKVSYSRVVAVLLDVVRGQDARIDDLEARIKRLEAGRD